MALVKAKGSLWISAGGAAAERFVPTRDNPECPIGYRCREPEFGDWDW